MKISTKGRYGLRSMFELAENFGKGPVLMESIAKHQAISRKYLHSLLTLLKSAGLVYSVRGAKGGYALAKAPEEISLREILEALEGPLLLTDCVGNSALCTHSEACLARSVWKELGSKFENILRTVSLSELIEEEANIAALCGRSEHNLLKQQPKREQPQQL